jgi:hypothetical protein
MHVGHLRTTIVGDAIARILDFELASQFTAFYEQCPVLKATDEAVRASRLALCGVGLTCWAFRSRSGCSGISERSGRSQAAPRQRRQRSQDEDRHSPV